MISEHLSGCLVFVDFPSLRKGEQRNYLIKMNFDPLPRLYQCDSTTNYQELLPVFFSFFANVDQHRIKKERD